MRWVFSGLLWWWQKRLGCLGCRWSENRNFLPKSDIGRLHWERSYLLLEGDSIPECCRRRRVLWNIRSRLVRGSECVSGFVPVSGEKSIHWSRFQGEWILQEHYNILRWYCEELCSFCQDKRTGCPGGWQVVSLHFQKGPEDFWFRW